MVSCLADFLETAKPPNYPPRQYSPLYGTSFVLTVVHSIDKVSKYISYWAEGLLSPHDSPPYFNYDVCCMVGNFDAVVTAVNI